MKKILLFIFFATNIISLYGQDKNFASLIVLITDEDDNKPIDSCKVIIKESGWMIKETNQEGRVYFENSVPIGEINYIVSKKGYIEVSNTFNITTEEKSNTLRIKLKKIEEEKFRIFGEITDENNVDLENVKIEIGILGEKFTGFSDDSGNFSIEIDSELKKMASEYKIEVKYENCEKYIKVGKIPQANFLEELIEIKCTAGKEDKQEIDLSVLELWEGKWMSTIMNMSLAEMEFKVKNGKIKGTYWNSMGKGTITPVKITRNLMKGKIKFRTTDGKLHTGGIYEFHLDESNMTFKGFFSNKLDNYATKNSWDGFKKSK